MTDETNGPDSLVLRYLRSIDGKIERIGNDLADLKSRVTALEGGFAVLAGQIAGMSTRLDWMEARLDRIDRRLGLVETT